MIYERSKARYILLAPVILYAIALTIFPLLYALYLSVTNYSFGKPTIRIVGLDNYVRIFQDYRVYNSLKVTLSLIHI